jgi:opacity protein-like surface antigen
MIRLTLASALAIAAAAPALAADPAYTPSFDNPPERVGEPTFVQAARGRFYVGTVNGVAALSRQRSRFEGPTTGFVLRTGYEVAAYSAGRFGYAFDPLFGLLHPRADVEVGYASNSVERQGAAPRIDSFGETRAFQGYANMYFDVDLGLPVRPYVGGGVGAAHVNMRRHGTSATGVFLDASDTGFAYHLDAGVGMDLSTLGSSSLLKGTTVEIGYRWTQAPDLRFGTRDGGSAKTDYQSNTVTFGTRKAF